MVKVKSEEFDDLINQDKLTIIDFSASWCMPCRMLKPIIEKVSNTLTNFNFGNVDIDECEDITKRYRIFSVPTIVAFKSGKKIDSMVGLNSYDEIVEFVNRCNQTEVN